MRELQPEEVTFHDEQGRSAPEPTAIRTVLSCTTTARSTQNLAIEGTPGEKLPPKPVPNYRGEGGIYGDFVQCVKTREKPFRDIELAVNTAVVSHLGNIAYQLKRSLKWDAAKQEFPGDAEANRLVDRARREPWQL